MLGSDLIATIVKQSMPECTGREILEELLGHLQRQELPHLSCLGQRPCLSQPGAQPQVGPEHAQSRAESPHHCWIGLSALETLIRFPGAAPQAGMMARR